MNLKSLLCFLGIILSVPFLVAVAMAVSLPITISAIGYLLASSLMLAGLIMAPRARSYHLVTATGMAAFILIAGTRIILGRLDSTSKLRMITLPQESGARWLSYILDEQDSLIFGEAIFHNFGGSSNEEHDGITQALYQAYDGMRQTQGIVPSPVINTYLNLQNPEAFDAVVIEPEVNQHPEVGVILLHGYMGNVTSQCWEIAQAASRVGVITVCPSTEWQGRWWEPRGETILKSTFEYLRGLGISKIYLGGFSNGGFGISRLAAQLVEEQSLGGLFFIDGFTNGANVAEIGVSVLIIQGVSDERVTVSVGRQFSNEIGNLGTYVEMEGDHFLIMKQPAQVQNAITTWLETQLGE